jgi:hypothetical protein
MISLISKFNIIVLEQNDAAKQLADLYIENKIIPEKYRMDATHIALATINSLDKIISLIFQHIVRDKTRTFVAYINTIYSYSSIDIKSPMEVIDND